MIQSSQPISLKFTCSCFLWQSLFLLLPNARRNAFSLLLLPGRPNPRVRRSMGRPPRYCSASSSKHSCLESAFFLVCNPCVTMETRRGSDRCFLRMRSSAPKRLSRSRELMLKKYLCRLSCGPRSSREDREVKTLKIKCLCRLLAPSNNRHLA
uniref:Uncharacterized protein n=1 Tax=Periophthalmus magnuspinnatus TaxID=409849 RepID=A0A3B4AEJ5_9GOBI